MTVMRFAACALIACLVPINAAAQGVTLPAVERVVLDNGAVIILLEKRDVPLVGV